MINADVLADYVAREAAVANALTLHEVYREMGLARDKVKIGPDAAVFRRRDELRVSGIDFADEAARDDFVYRLHRRLGPEA